MTIGLLILSLIGIAILSAALSIVITHFILRGIEILLPLRHPVHYQATNANERKSDHNHNHTTTDDIPVYPITIRRCDLYDIIRTRINKVAEQQIGKFCPKEEATTNTKKDHSYVNRHPPCVTQHPFPSPTIKHILTIVNKLRRLVNHSGKEPAGWLSILMSCLPTIIFEVK